MEIITKTVENRSVVVLDGELEMNNVSEVKKQILGFDFKEMIIDFEKVTYLDSAGIGMLISLHKTALLKGGRLEIINVDSKIKKLFEMVGLTKILNIS